MIHAVSLEKKSFQNVVNSDHKVSSKIHVFDMINTVMTPAEKKTKDNLENLKIQISNSALVDSLMSSKMHGEIINPKMSFNVNRENNSISTDNKTKYQKIREHTKMKNQSPLGLSITRYRSCDVAISQQKDHNKQHLRKDVMDSSKSIQDFMTEEGKFFRNIEEFIEEDTNHEKSTGKLKVQNTSDEIVANPITSSS